jgi:integrase
LIDDMPKRKYPNVHQEAHRGVVYWYFRRGHGARVRLRGDYGSPEFMASYQEALRAETLPKPQGVAPARQGSFGWLVTRYQDSAAWAAFSEATRRQQSNILSRVLKTAGNSSIAAVTKDSVQNGLDKRKATPGAANNFLKTMRSLFRWAMKAGLASSDPTAGVGKITYSSEGFAVWTDDDIAAFEKRWPIGTRERLALVILLCTGLRRGDAASLGRQHIRDGVIIVRTQKTGQSVFLPVLPALQAAIDATPSAGLALIAGQDGKPMTKESFGNWFGDACRAAKIVGKSAHGLRKYAATYAAENGATERELMALFGWGSGKMAAHYTQTADRARLAKEAIGKMARNEAGSKNPERGSVRETGDKKRRKIK